jgi:DNA-binding protein H-NS
MPSRRRRRPTRTRESHTLINLSMPNLDWDNYRRLHKLHSGKPAAAKARDAKKARELKVRLAGRMTENKRSADRARAAGDQARLARMTQRMAALRKLHKPYSAGTLEPGGAATSAPKPSAPKKAAPKARGPARAAPKARNPKGTSRKARAAAKTARRAGR